MNSGNQTGESVAVGKSVGTRAEWSLNVWCLFCALMVHVFGDIRLRKVVDLEGQQRNCNEGSLSVSWFCIWTTAVPVYMYLAQVSPRIEVELVLHCRTLL